MNRLTAARLGYGLVLVVAPGLVVRAYGARSGRPDRAVAVVLGWRQVLQAAACAGSPGSGVLLLGAEADAAHALSAAALAATDRTRRRAGLTEGILACTFAAAGLMAARRAGPSETNSETETETETGAAARLVRWRTCAAERVAGLAVPAVVRRWAAQGDAR